MNINYRQKNIQTDGGFLALTATLILSAVLLLVMFNGSISGFFARFDSLGSEFKRVSLGLSESCSNAALLKIAQNYDYSPSSGGEVVNVGTNNCTIKSVSCVNSPCEDISTHTKKLKITTFARYPSINGSWSTNEIVATVRNPSIPLATPPPTCSFSVNPSSINAGEQVILQWSTAGSATSFLVERAMAGTTTTLYSGPVIPGPLNNSPSESATYTATITGPGGSTQCATPQSVVVHPSLAECADTSMMLARSMNPGDVDQERNAANAFLDLYSIVTPHPQASVGTYTGLNGSPAQIPISGQLTTSYASLYTTIGLITKTNGTDVSAGIAAAATELNTDTAHGGRHVAGRAKVLILVSPTGGHSSDVNAALSVADTAKLNGIEIFTLDFGDSGTLDDWAKLASGNTPYPGHQNGSHNEAANANDAPSVAAENSDGDHFFVIPKNNSSMIVDLFETIATIVCPGVIPPGAPPPPPPPPPPPAPPPPISIGSWGEVIEIP